MSINHRAVRPVQPPVRPQRRALDVLAADVRVAIFHLRRPAVDHGKKRSQIPARDPSLLFSERFDKQKYGSDAAPLHDPSVIAYLLKPSLFSGRFVNVEIETESLLTLGMTVADWWGVSGREANANFIGDVDIEGFFNLLTERLAVL